MTYDTIIVGASFAGLTLASRLSGKVLLIDRDEIGEGQTSACGCPSYILTYLGLEKSILQCHSKAVIETSWGKNVVPLTQEYCTFDYNSFCCGLLGKSKAEITFLKDVVTGGTSTSVTTKNSEYRANQVVDCSGYRRLLDPHPTESNLSFGLEGLVDAKSDEGLRFIIDSKIGPGYAWVFPAGRFTRVGIGSYRGSEGLSQKLHQLIDREFGVKPIATHGGAIPKILRLTVANGIFFVGDSAGHCYPATCEGIRPTIEAALACGDLLERVSNQELDIGEAASMWSDWNDLHLRSRFRKLTILENSYTRLPSILLQCLLSINIRTGIGGRAVERYVRCRV